ncbi:MAG: AsmA-like C-terminal region-containing protein [Xanthomonadales bacterium]|nr:AsmA-like C-terminal region-containing protein [Xanthomonadales bacterium]
MRRLRQWLAAIAAVAIIATAVIVGTGRLLIPYADDMRPWLEQQLSERLGQPVSIERVEARWPRLTPQITLNGLRAGGEDGALIDVARARLELHLPDLVRADRNPFRLVLLGLDLVLAEDESGRWGLRMETGGRLSGLPGGSGQALAGDLLVRDASVRIHPHTGPRVELVISEGEIRRRGDETSLVARAHPAAAPDAELSLALLGEQSDGRLQSLTGRVDLSRLRLEAPGLKRVLPDLLRVPPDRMDAHLDFDWHVERGGALDLDVGLSGSDGFDAGARIRIEQRDRRIDAELIRLESGGRTIAQDIVIAQQGDRWAASVPELALSDVHELLSRWFGGWQHWPASVAGGVRDLDLLYQHPGSLHRLGGTVEGFTLDLPGERVSLADLDLDLGVAGDRAALTLSGSPVVDWPEKMRRPVPIERISGRVIVSPRAVELDGVAGWRPEAQAQADGWVWLGGGRPFLDFVIVSDRVGAIDPRPWLPAGQIPPTALNWLDRALLGISGATGGLNYHFRLGHKFPSWRAGDFQAWLDFRGADLDYWEGWPVARELEGRVDFVGRSMVARVDRGRLGRVPLSADRIAIDDLVEPEIDFDLSTGDVEAGVVRDLVAALPFEGWSRFTDRVSAKGSVSVRTELFLPIGRMDRWRLAGEVTLAGATLSLPAAGLRFPGLRGRVAFDRSGIAPTTLQLAGQDSPELEVAAGFVSPAWISLDGSLSLVRLLPETGAAAVLAERISGASTWQARLDAHPSGGWQLEARSDLSGVALDLPRPLQKPAGESMPLDVSLRGHDSGLTFSGRLGQLISLTAEEVEGRWRLAAGLGQAAPALPSSTGFDVAGRVDRLDLMAWGDWLSKLPLASSPAVGAGQGRVRLRLGRLDYGDLSLRDVALESRRGDGQWQASLSGATVEGEITVPLPIDSGRVVAIDLQRLDLAHSLGDKQVEDLAEAPVPAQTRTRVPTEFPPISLLVESLHYGDFPLGRLRIESHARQDGIEIELIEVAGPRLELSGYGRWILAEGGPVTEFEGRLISTDLPALLATMGRESQFEAARAQVDLDGRWTGAPTDFSLARLSGTMNLLMVDGNIPEAQPGAGRLVGLISLSAMPRRLMLDFRDVFGQGLKFDRIEGSFRLDGGIARTDGLRLESPAADITVRGRTDLGGQTYDQTVLVEPGVGGTLPVLGGLAGGPAGAAAGLILRSLLERPLQGIAEARYRVTGPWADPNVELIGARAAEPDYRLEGGQEEEPARQEAAPNEPDTPPTD